MTKMKLLFLLLGAFLFRLLLSSFGTLQLDQGTFIAWSMDLAQNGFKNFYNGWSDYLPGYLYVLFVLGKINLLNLIPQEILYKLPAIFADIATGLLIYKILIKNKSERLALIGSAIYLFNPAIFGNSSLWGQVDSFVALFALLSVYVFPNRYWLSAIYLAIGTLIKPQVAFIFPVVLYMFYTHKKRFTNLLVYCITGLLVFFSGFIPFWSHSNLFQFVFERLALSSAQYPYTSVNAFNFWGITGFWRPDTYQWIVGISTTIIIFITFIKFIKKQKEQQYLLAGIILSSSFLFMTRMHERHFLPSLVFLAISAVENPKLLTPYIGFSAIYVANLYYAYVWITDNFKAVFSNSLTKIISLINVIFLGLALFPVQLKLKFKSIKSNIVSFPKVNFDTKNYKYILWGILIFATIARFYNLGNPPSEYFDEVYHAFTAKVMLHDDRAKAWEWWNTPPEGFAYEWTHPPLAKVGMALGMMIFGENSFGYRFFGAILGVAIIYLIYLLAKEVFKDELLALISAGVYSLDGLALVISRIGMNDNYILFFSLLCIYLFIKNKNFGSAVAFGFAVASKWSAIWSLPILFILWLRRKNKFEPSLFLAFSILPLCIYLLSYLQMFLTGHGLDIWWGMQKQMWWYHTGLVATHPYTSSWWSWPLLLRPIYLYTSSEVNNTVSRIYAFGNPIVFWFGLASIFTSLIYAFQEKNKNLALIVFSYFIFFAPWALSPRIMFLYHYLPSIPFLAIATGYVLRRNPKLIYWMFGIGLLIFIYFYPHWAGLRIPIWLDTSYYWLDSWR